jgi:hypothetical protein
MGYLKNVVIFSIKFLKAVKKFYPVLSIYGDTAVELEEGSIHLQFGKTIPFLIVKISNINKRVC